MEIKINFDFYISMTDSFYNSFYLNFITTVI